MPTATNGRKSWIVFALEPVSKLFFPRDGMPAEGTKVYITRNSQTPFVPAASYKRVLKPVLVFFALLIAGISGCSSGDKLTTYPATVELTYPKGEPIVRASVRFRSVDNQKITARGRTNLDGVCKLTTYETGDGAILGRHQAIVSPPVPKGDLDEARIQPVPSRYGNYQTSELEFTVTENESENQFKIVITPR